MACLQSPCVFCARHDRLQTTTLRESHRGLHTPVCTAAHIHCALPILRLIYTAANMHGGLQTPQPAYTTPYGHCMPAGVGTAVPQSLIPADVRCVITMQCVPVCAHSQTCHACVFACAHAHRLRSTPVYMHKHMHAGKHAHTCARACANACVYIRTCMQACLCTRMHALIACTRACIHVQMHCPYHTQFLPFLSLNAGSSDVALICVFIVIVASCIAMQLQ